MKLNEVFTATRIKKQTPFIKSSREVDYFKLLSYFTDRYGPKIGAGRHRVGFARGNVVVKVPKNDQGMIDNIREYNMYQRSLKDPKGYHPMARNKLLYVDDVPILYIEKLDVSDRLENYPPWAEEIDSLQVGRDKKGKWKAFDYAE